MTSSRRIVAILSALFLLPVIAVTTAAATAMASQPAAAADGPPFTPIRQLALGRDAAVRPASYAASRTDLSTLRGVLAKPGRVTLAIPDPSGASSTFTVVEDSVMAPVLQAAHPEIRTYRGSATDGSTIRLDLTPFGFHAMVRMPDGKAWYVDPAYRKVGETRVLSYAGSAMPAPDQAFVEKDVDQAGADRAASDALAKFGAPGGVVTKRTFRLALLTDPTYAQYVAPGETTHAGSDPLVLAAKTTLVNRVNEVYNDDLGIEFQLIAETNKLNLLQTEDTEPDGPCGADACFSEDEIAGCDVPTLNRMEFVLGQLVGADRFDIGHLGLGVNGGGVAYLGVVGGLNSEPGFGNEFQANKAGGCTGLPQPIGDFYAIDYVAHEMGHQMGSDHTFNGTIGNCSGGNRDTTPFDIQVEPGSGSSVMAYAGICGRDNLQPHSDPYFSYASNDVINATTAHTPQNLEERQTVNLADFDGTDAFTISCAGCATSGPVTNGSNYTVAGLETAVQAATGKAATVTGYDDGAFGTEGFTVTWPVGAGDVPTLVVTPTSGTFTTFTGTVRQGGPTTNQGATGVTGNHAPVVTAPADKTIPARTPFTLTGSGTDPDRDPLTYLWEQADAGGATGTALLNNTKVDGPLFRQFGVAAQVSPTDTLLYHSPGENLAGTSPSRTFPDLAQVVAGVTNAATGACPAPPPSGAVPQATIDCYSEFLPTSAWVGQPSRGSRVMHFRLTARDEFSADAAADHTGGQAFDEVALTVNPSAGPFLVTSRPSGGTASGVERVRWSVAGTNDASMARKVRIRLSTDGGVTFPYVLAKSTPNDGSQVVALPGVTTSTARIKVEAVGNYFFDVNDANFAIHGKHVGDGSGRFSSPQGSSERAPGAHGTAKFDFSAESFDSADGGQATLRFKKGQIRFEGIRARAVDVSGHTLTMRVKGTNRGFRGYTLVVVAVDKGKHDKIRLRLFRGKDKTLVYDSMPGARANAKPKTKVRGQVSIP